MAKACHGRSIWLQVAIVIILVIVIDGVAAIGEVDHVNTKMRTLVKPFKKPAATIKTIQSEDGDIIDCVDIYKQPAFDHPALKNHTIQMRPSDYIEEEIPARNASSPIASLAQPVPTNESCPEGTIPILRTRHNDMLKENSPTVSPISEVSAEISYKLNTNTRPHPCSGEEVVLRINGDAYYGASAYVNVWEPLHVEPQEESSSLIVLSRLNPSGVNFVSAGLTVSKPLYGDQRTRLTVYWTADNSRNTGCHNVNCPGFIQTNSRIHLGGSFAKTSFYGGDQQDRLLTIYLDRHSNNWWLKYRDQPVGYWPSNIFRDLSTASAIKWGGRVGLQSAYYCGKAHSTTEMGNGHYPSQGGFGASAYLSSALYRLEDNVDRAPDGGLFFQDNQNCYSYKDYGNGFLSRPGRTFFFGGNGKQPGCY